MSDYTPTTESVRGAYLYEAQRHGDAFLGNAATRAEFDRWLKSVKAEAWGEGYDVGWNTVATNPYMNWRTSVRAEDVRAGDTVVVRTVQGNHANPGKEFTFVALSEPHSYFQGSVLIDVEDAKYGKAELEIGGYGTEFVEAWRQP